VFLILKITIKIIKYSAWVLNSFHIQIKLNPFLSRFVLRGSVCWCW